MYRLLDSRRVLEARSQQLNVELTISQPIHTQWTFSDFVTRSSDFDDQPQRGWLLLSDGYALLRLEAWY